MLRSIRHGVFETNSSSTHSITILSEEEFKSWKNGKYVYCNSNEKLVLKEEVIENFKKDGKDIDFDDEDAVADLFSEYDYETYERFFNDEYLESYIENYKTKNGEKIVAFGKFGHEG